MITVEVSGSFDHLERFLKNVSKLDISGILHSSGQEGVNALSRATPIETGLAAHSWRYEVKSNGGHYEIAWLNGDIENGFNVIIALQYGHGTGTGGFVQGRDFINPAIKPVFDKIADQVWKAVISA
jgi:hypothetical protein